MNSAKDVIDNHIRQFRAGNLEGILDDFSPDAVMYTLSGTLRGKSEIKSLFQIGAQVSRADAARIAEWLLEKKQGGVAEL